MNDGLVYDPLSFDGFAFTVFYVFIDNVLQIIDVIDIGVAQAVDGWVDVAGHGNINEKYRAVASCAYGPFYLFAVYD